MIELGLSRMQKLLAHTPLPWRAIHVAGTNGKGSVCAYVSAMLNAYNKSEALRMRRLPQIKHARFTSPHLVDRWDCITVDGKVVSKQIFDEVESQFLARNESRGIGATEFELLTATAFEIFRRSKIDVGVVEVGMGGRLDSTNIIGQVMDESDVPAGVSRPPPLVCGITSIGLDHQDFLGRTREAIAREKCGIIKPGVPVVASAQETKSVEAVIKDCADERSSELTFVSDDTSARDIWAVFSGDEAYVNTLGSQPVQKRWTNGALAATLAWNAIHRLGRLDQVPPEIQGVLLEDMCRVPDTTTWPGRLQHIDLTAMVGSSVQAVLDGAHNAQSATLLRRYLDDLDDQRPTEWVIGASSTKDVAEMLKIMIRPGDAINAVEFGAVDGMPWVAPLEAHRIVLEGTRISPGRHQAFGRRIDDALKHAAMSANDNGRRLVIAGSLYLIGDVQRMLRNAN